jgi:hypothetical protein
MVEQHRSAGESLGCRVLAPRGGHNPGENMPNYRVLAFAVGVCLGGCAQNPSEGLGEKPGALAALARLEPARAGEQRLVGRVDQVLSAGSYTYARVISDAGSQRWVVTLSRGIAPGASVEVENMGTRRQFHSKRLRRTFDELVFGIVREQAAAGERGLS